jgi:hypothetical protein
MNKHGVALNYMYASAHNCTGYALFIISSLAGSAEIGASVGKRYVPEAPIGASPQGRDK